MGLLGSESHLRRILFNQPRACNRSMRILQRLSLWYTGRRLGVCDVGVLVQRGWCIELTFRRHLPHHQCHVRVAE